jgi:mono/diheme cytochrome c family protein
MRNFGHRLVTVILCAAALLTAGGLAPETASPPAAPAEPGPLPAPERGHALVVRDCGRCHAVEATGASPFQAAPPFRTLHDHYPLESLEEALAEGIISGHPDMPEVAYSASEVAEVIAWMKSLDRP